MSERVEAIRRRMKEIGTVFIQDGNGYHVVPGQEEAASFLADAAWTLSGALAQAERERDARDYERFGPLLRYVQGMVAEDGAGCACELCSIWTDLIRSGVKP